MDKLIAALDKAGVSAPAKVAENLAHFVLGSDGKRTIAGEKVTDELDHHVSDLGDDQKKTIVEAFMRFYDAEGLGDYDGKDLHLN